jgi:uridine kinase
MELDVGPGDIVIIEGVIALTLAQDDSDFCHKFAVCLDEDERRQRFISEYKRRSSNDDYAESLYQQRMHDEYEFVRKLMTKAKEIQSFTSLNFKLNKKNDNQ